MKIELISKNEKEESFYFEGIDYNFFEIKKEKTKIKVHKGDFLLFHSVYHDYDVDIIYYRVEKNFKIDKDSTMSEGIKKLTIVSQWDILEYMDKNKNLRFKPLEVFYSIY